MLHVMSTPRLCIYISFLSDGAREELEPVGKGAQFFSYRGALQEFLEVEVHNQNEVTDSSVLSMFLKILHGVLLPSYKLENGLTEA